MTAITALFVDDHIAIRESYRLLLSQFAIEVIAEADNGELALQLYSQLQPDIVIMDLSINGMNGMECTAQLLKQHPAARVVVFSMHDNSNFATRTIKRGAMAYVLKSDPSTVLIDAIKQVYYQAKPFLSPTLANTIALQNIPPSNDKLSHLSDREYSIFLLLAEGKSRHEIADILSLSSGTISNNKTRILQKLHVQSEHDLTAIALEENLLKHTAIGTTLLYP